MAQRQNRPSRTLPCLVCAAAGLCSSTAATAAVTQPDGSVVPVDESISNDYAESSSKRFRPETLGLQSMLNAWEGVEPQQTNNSGKARPRIDAYTDANASSVTFSPLCGLQVALILRGSMCQMDFGWYCADDPIGNETIHTLVSATDVLNYYDNILATLSGKPPPPPDSWAGYKNSDKAFVPTIQAGCQRPVASTSLLSDVRGTPDYKACKSGKIGFALRGAPGSICPMSKFSEPLHSQVSNYGGKPWINAVVYQSKRDFYTFYIAFEDMPTTPATFRPLLGDLRSTYPAMTSSHVGWQELKNDGDMNDFVYKVEGIACEGGGMPCVPMKDDGMTPWKGGCSLGRTGCSTQPNTPGACLQRVYPTAEICNDWDDDCDGVVDNGDSLCPENYVCEAGKCVGACGRPGFECSDPNTICQESGKSAGHCLDKACLGVVCPVGARCEAGGCIASCENRPCPGEFACISGNCVDLCAGVECPANSVCESGTCVPDCKCLPCRDPKRSLCNADGHCVVDPCQDVVCGDFSICVAGSCVDPCASKPCAAGSRCTATVEGIASCSPTARGTGGTDGSTAIPATAQTLVSGAGSLGNVPNEQPGCGCWIAGTTKGRSLTTVVLVGVLASRLRLHRRRSVKRNTTWN